MSTRSLLATAWIALAVVASSKAGSWNPSFETARRQSSAAGRPILINFTGSDWCPACIQLKNTILNSPDFQTFAEERLILMEVDFPRTRPMAALHLQANQQLARKYSVTAFPTVMMVDTDGKMLGQIANGVTKEQFLQALDYLAKKFPTSAEKPQTRQPRQPDPIKELPLFGGAALQPIPTFTNLMVKSISGPAGRRFALINRETMTTGDVAWFGLGATNRIQVKCLDVREKSVLVRVHGEASERELLLADIR